MEIAKTALMITGFVLVMVLPMLAHSRREFLIVKGVNLLAGIGLGATAMWIGY